MAATLHWLVEGHDEAHIRDALAAEFPGCRPDEVLMAAGNELAADARCSPSVLKGWALRCYRELYRRCLDIGDFDGARKILKEMVCLATR